MTLAAHIFWAPLRIADAWKRAREQARGEPGIRCGGCDKRPPEGERLCDECHANNRPTF